MSKSRSQFIPVIVTLTVVGVMVLGLAFKLKPAALSEIQSTENTESPAQPESSAGLSISAEPQAAAPDSPAPAMASASTQDPVTIRKLQTLDQVLASRNDNDPRLDREFRGLSRETKAALRAKYGTLPAEDRNGRGTVVFLIGREANEPADMDFLRQVLSEAPCLSLADCSRDGATNAAEELHHEGITEITLAYPQLVALKWIEVASPSMDDATREAALRAINAAKSSRNPIVARKASELEKRLERP